MLVTASYSLSCLLTAVGASMVAVLFKLEYEPLLKGIWILKATGGRCEHIYAAISV